MNPEIQAQLDKMQKQIDTLMEVTDTRFIESIKIRVFEDMIEEGATSAPATITQAVDEAGSATYDVSKAPTGALTLIGKNQNYTIAYY